MVVIYKEPMSECGTIMEEMKGEIVSLQSQMNLQQETILKHASEIERLERAAASNPAPYR